MSRVEFQELSVSPNNAVAIFRANTSATHAIDLKTLPLNVSFPGTVVSDTSCSNLKKNT
jgi:hypothetical protein